MSESVVERLASVRHEYGERKKSLEDDQRACENESHEVRRTIRKLQNRLAELSRSREELRVREEATRQAYLAKERRVVLNALDLSHTTIEEAWEYWRLRDQLESKRRGLLEEYPKLNESLHYYREFERDSSRILDSLAPPYRAAVIAEHEAMRKRLDPYLTLESQIEAMSPPDSLTLQLFLVQNREAGEVHWVLPIKVEELGSEAPDTPLHPVIRTLMDALVELSSGPEWRVGEARLTEWHAYAALALSGGYVGHGNVLATVAELLQEEANRTALLGEVPVSCPVADMAWDVWAFEEPVESDEEDDAQDEVLSHLAEETQGWYTQEDVRAWQAPLKVTEGSGWNVQARRLRTLLVRLLAHGQVGEAGGAPVSLLREHLPVPHAESLALGIERLVAAEVLRERMDEDGAGYVSLVPEHLADVRDLINRDVTSFWSAIVQE